MLKDDYDIDIIGRQEYAPQEKGEISLSTTAPTPSGRGPVHRL